MPGPKLGQSLAARIQPPPAGVVRQRLNDYLERTGMTSCDMALEVGRLGKSSVRHFLAGTYKRVAASDDVIRAKLWDYLERHPLDDPDDDIPERLLQTRDTRLLLERIEQAHRKGRIIVVEGPPGTSKTTVLKWYWIARNQARKRDAFYLRAWTGITGVALLRALCRLVGANPAAVRDRLLSNLVRKLRARQSYVLLVDEAQHLHERSRHSIEAFEQLRDVIDLAGCGCVLAGHFNFIKALSDGLGSDLEQWLSRIDLHEHLGGLTEEEMPKVAQDYLGQELPKDVLRLLGQAALAKDRHAALRSALAPKLLRGRKRPPVRYLSIRRVRKFFDRIEELKAIPQNQGAPLPDLARAALKMLMAPEGTAL
ncbi:MAG: AAA family ATPase [Terriglobia bacterium]